VAAWGYFVLQDIVTFDDAAAIDGDTRIVNRRVKHAVRAALLGFRE
jgi:hypothetical protein